MLRCMQAQIEGLQTAAAAAPAPAATGAVEAAAPVPPAGPIAPMTKEEAKQTVLEVQVSVRGDQARPRPWPALFARDHLSTASWPPL